MAALDELDTVLPPSELGHQLILVSLELIDSCLLRLLLLIEIIGSFDEGNKAFKVLQGVFLVKELGSLDLSEAGDVDHLSEGGFKEHSLLSDESLGDVELRFPLLVVEVTVLQLGNVNLSVLRREQGEVLAALVSLSHQDLQTAFALHHVLHSHDLRGSFVLLLLHLVHHFLQLFLIKCLFLGGTCHQTLMI